MDTDLTEEEARIYGGRESVLDMLRREREEESVHRRIEDNLGLLTPQLSDEERSIYSRAELKHEAAGRVSDAKSALLRFAEMSLGVPSALLAFGVAVLWALRGFRR